MVDLRVVQWVIVKAVQSVYSMVDVRAAQRAIAMVLKTVALMADEMVA